MIVVAVNHAPHPRPGQKRLRLNQAHLLILRPALQQGRRFTQQFLRRAILQEPVHGLLPLQYQGHAGMDRLHGSVCLCRKDHKPVAVLILPVTPGHEHGIPVLPVKSMLLFIAVPLIEPGRRKSNRKQAILHCPHKFYPENFWSGFCGSRFPTQEGCIHCNARFFCFQKPFIDKPV